MSERFFQTSWKEKQDLELKIKCPSRPSDPRVRMACVCFSSCRYLMGNSIVGDDRVAKYRVTQ